MSNKVNIRTKKPSLSKWLFGGVATIALVVSALVAALSVMAAGPTYTITYVNGSTTYTKNYDAGSTVTLDALPSGAIAWTDDSSSTAPNGKMAYVNYSHTETVNGVQTPINIPMTLTLNGNMTLTANYGSYATGQGPRMVQYHLELKYMDMTTNQMMQYEQHYISINAPAGYYIQLPPSNYFGNTLYADVNSSGSLSDTGQSISDWVSDGSYTGTTTEPQSNIFAPNALIYVDPNNYNMIYDAMVTPPAPVTPPPIPANDTITFRISQANIPPASVCQDLFGVAPWRTCSGSFWLPWGDNQPGAAQYVEPGLYIMWYSGSTQLTISNLQDSTTWENALPQLANTALGSPLPFAVVYPNYNYYWDMDGVNLPTTNEVDNGVTYDTTLANYLNGAGISPQDAIGGSHVFTLHYVPIPATVQLYVDGHTDSVVYDGASHSVSGYDVYDCSGVANINQDNLLGSGCTPEGTSPDGSPLVMANGDTLNFTNTSGNSNVTATGTNVGTYPMTLTTSDFSVNNSVTSDLYNLTMSNGGLTITQKTLPIVVTPPIDPSTPGDQTVVVTPTNPGDLPPGQVIITPGTGITNNGDGTSTTDGNTNVNVNVDGDGNITYIDPKTGNPIPYDPTLPNGGIIWIGDTNNNDPNTGKPTDVTNNYNPKNVLPNPIKKPGSNNGGGIIVPGVPNTGRSK